MTQDDDARLLADALKHDPQMYERACRRMKSAPQLLDDDDFEQLRIVSPRLASLAHEAQGAALRAARPVGGGNKTPTRTDAPPRAGFDETKFLARHGHKPVSTSAFFTLINAIRARLAALEKDGGTR